MSKQETDWIVVATIAQIPNGDILPLEIAGLKLILTRVGDRVAAYGNSCTHLDMPLDCGKIEKGIITCFFHKYRYRLATGECLTMPNLPLKSYPLKREGDRVLIKLSDVKC